MKKIKFYTELAYILGIIGLAIGTAFMEKANFGVSMVVAPAYLAYLKLSQIWSFVTFGMMEYIFQAILLIALVIVLRKFRLSFLFSFVTAVIYGFALDGSMALVAMSGDIAFWLRIVFFIAGMLLCALGVAFIFRTYIAPEVYELFVKELAARSGREVSRVKTAYDCISCLAAVAMSFLFFGFMHFEGVKLGTVICALLNGRIIMIMGRIMDKYLGFTDGLPLRRFFEKV